MYPTNLEQDLLHPLASLENCINTQSNILLDIKAALMQSQPPGVTNADIAALASGQNIPYRVLKIPLTNVGVNVPYNVIGGNFVAASDGSLAGITISLGSPQNDALPLLFFVGQQIPVTTMYVSWPAQAGKTLYIAVGAPGFAFNLSQIGAAQTVTQGEWTLYNSNPLAIGTFYATNVDWRTGNRLCLYIVNTMDQAVTVQAFGNKVNASTNIALIDVPKVLPIGNVTTQVLSIVLNGDDLWHPFIGVQITTLVAPTVGSLVITADIQE
jgi:hypothetical protein